MMFSNVTNAIMKCLLYLDAEETKRYVPGHELSAASGLSTSMLARYWPRLAAAGLIETKTSHSGGLRLTKPLDQIFVGSLAEIVEREDLRRVPSCASEAGCDCYMGDGCGFDEMYSYAERQMFRVLDKFTLAEFQRPGHRDAARQFAANYVKTRQQSRT
jgi:Rrf2 family protein